MTNIIAGSNSIFPGFYRDKKDPGNVGYVSSVKDGRVCYRGTKGRIKSASMGAMDFMQRFEKVENSAASLVIPKS